MQLAPQPSWNRTGYSSINIAANMLYSCVTAFFYSALLIHFRVFGSTKITEKPTSSLSQPPTLLHVLLLYFSCYCFSTGTQKDSVSHSPGIFSHKLDIYFSLHAAFRIWGSSFSVALFLFWLLCSFKLCTCSASAMLLILSLDNLAVLDIWRY